MTQTQATQEKSDTWSTWLLGRRHGNDSAYQQRMLNVVENYRERVLDGAQLRPGMTLADVGTGDGLIAFGAIARVGSSLRVIFTDISQPLVDHVEQLAIHAGPASSAPLYRDRPTSSSASVMQSVDVVATRAVLTYVAQGTSVSGILSGAQTRRAHLAGRADISGRCGRCVPINQTWWKSSRTIRRSVFSSARASLFAPASSRRRPPPLCKARSPITTSAICIVSRAMPASSIFIWNCTSISVRLCQLHGKLISMSLIIRGR